MGALRILHVVGGLANASGTTHIILDLSAELVAQGHEVEVFYVAGRTPDTVAPADPRIKATGFPLTAGKRWAWSRELAQTLRATVSGFDVVHTHSLWQHLHWTTYKTVRATGTPYICSPQGALDAWSLQQRAWRKRIYATLVEKRVLNRAACIHAVSEHERHVVRSAGVHAPVAVVPNGVAIPPPAARPDREEARAALELPRESPAVLFLGRLHPKKGIDLLLDGFRAVRAEMPTAQLLIAGTDGGSGYRERLQEQTGLGVRFLGELAGDRKQEALAAADLFVLMSHAEGMPIAVLEALAMGCPVLVTEACHLPEVEEAGAGLVLPRDAGALTKSLQDLLGKPAVCKRMGASARHLAEECFAWPVVAQRMAMLYEAVAEGRDAEEVLGRVRGSPQAAALQRGFKV